MTEKNQNFDEIKQRILLFAENQGIKKGDLYKKIDISQSNFSGEGAKSSLKSENIIKVLIAFPDLNPEWLLLGRGGMLRNTMTNSINGHGNIANNGDLNNSGTIDLRSYNSDSPDVLRAQIDLLDERIKEKDAQIKDLHEIIKQLSRKD